MKRIYQLPLAPAMKKTGRMKTPCFRREVGNSQKMENCPKFISHATVNVLVENYWRGDMDSMDLWGK
jgi:hypothetical protein